MRRFAVASALSCLFLHLSPASAATLQVPKDHPTIQAAVDAAAPGDVIEIPPDVVHTMTCQDAGPLLWAALWWPAG